MDKQNFLCNCNLRKIDVLLIVIASLFFGFSANAGTNFRDTSVAGHQHIIRKTQIKQDIFVSNEMIDFDEMNCAKNLPAPLYATIYTNLVIPTQNGNVLMDGVANVYNNQFSADVDGDDALKLWNFNENIAIARCNSMLSIEFRPEPKVLDTVFYKLYLKQQAYALQLFTKNISLLPKVRAVLIDKYLNKKTELNLTDTTLYKFTPTPDTNSYRNRFMLVLYKQVNTAPVQYVKDYNQKDPSTSGVAATSLGSSKIIITPNPVTNIKDASIKFINIEKGRYNLTVYNSNGRQLCSQQVDHNGNNTSYNIYIKESLSKGIYIIRVADMVTGKAFNLQFIQSGK